MVGYLSMVILTVAWNSIRKSSYLQVQYEWKRILMWFALYIVYVIVIQWKRDFSLLGESIVSLLALLPLPFMVYMLLSSWERHNIVKLFKQFQTRLAGDVSN